MRRTHANKSQVSRDNAVANRSAAGKHEGNSTVQFADNSPESLQFRKMQSMADNSPQAANAAQMQTMANSSPYSVAEPGPAVQRKVVTVGTEKVDVDSTFLGFLTKKGKAERKEAEEIFNNVKDTYGIDISSSKLIEGIKDQYTNVPKEVTDSLKIREWKMIELRSIAKALKNFAPILGEARADSTRKGDDQEVTAFGKAKNAIDSNAPAGKLDTDTLGEYFKGKKVMGTFKSSEGATPDFSDEGDQLVGTFVHETAHGLLSYAYDDFVKASDGYWTDQNTKSGKAGAEEPPTSYGKTNAKEDMCETAMLYFVKKSRLNGFPKRLVFMEKLGTSWVPPVKDATQVTK